MSHHIVHWCTGAQFVTLVCFVPSSDAVPVSQSHHAATAGSSAAERHERDDDEPSTPRCSLPERWCALLQTQCPLIQDMRGQTNNSTIIMHTIIEKRSLSSLPVYETGLPAKSDHFFTSASLMTSLLLSTTIAEKTQGCWCGGHLKTTTNQHCSLKSLFLLENMK